MYELTGYGLRVRRGVARNANEQKKLEMPCDCNVPVNEGARGKILMELSPYD